MFNLFTYEKLVKKNQYEQEIEEKSLKINKDRESKF